uniref:TIL domain-containing protein n=1 Tax=Anopheles funestus TaxID=62324 RepID=A0A4Y0BLE7_ANOFN
MQSTHVYFLIVILTFTLAYVYSAPEKCGPNEYYSECGSIFELNCFRRDRQTDDPFGCDKGCFCNPGYLREFESGKCITARECPIVPYK